MPFIFWNVVSVNRPANATWTINLIGRDTESIAMVHIKKTTVAEAQGGILSLNCAGDQTKPVAMGEDCGITIVSRDACYQTDISIYNSSEEEGKRIAAAYAGLEENAIAKMAKERYENSRNLYLKWKDLPQTPLEDCASRHELKMWYLGLPHIVFMHLVGQLCVDL